MNPSLLPTHAEVINHLWSNIISTFEAVGASTPAPHELHPSDSWIYCQTAQQKDKGKIGYRCTFNKDKQGRPVVIIIVNSFKHGGQKVIFNSSNCLQDNYPAHSQKRRLIRPTPHPIFSSND